MKKTINGFTIVELLIVIVVIAILAAISVVAYTGVRNRARTSSAQFAASTVAKKVELYYTGIGNYPTRFSDLTGAASTDPYLLTGITLAGTLSNPDTPDNAVHLAPCGTGNPANISAITTANVSGAMVYYRNYINSSNDFIRIGTTSTTGGVACHWAGS